MKANKREKLEAKGWKIGDASDFLALSSDEAAYVELKLKLSDQLRVKRQKQRLSQAELANFVGSSQSRVAKMESADTSVSLDLLVRSLLALGATPKELGRAIST